MSKNFYDRRNVDYEPIQHAIYRIQDEFGVHTNWTTSPSKTLDKWGQREDDIDATLKTVWGSPANFESYRDTNIIDSFVSTRADITETLQYEGHTIDGSGNLTFSRGSINLNGQTPVTIDVPLARLTRAFLANGQTFLTTDYVYGYASSLTTVTGGTPDNDDAIHIRVRGGAYRQSEKAATAIDKNSFFIVTSLFASLGASKTGSVEIYFQKRIIGNEFRAFVPPFFLNDNQINLFLPFEHPLIIENNSDFRVLAKRTSGTQSLTIVAKVGGKFLRNTRAGQS